MFTLFIWTRWLKTPKAYASSYGKSQNCHPQNIGASFFLLRTARNDLGPSSLLTKIPTCGRRDTSLCRSRGATGGAFSTTNSWGHHLAMGLLPDDVSAAERLRKASIGEMLPWRRRSAWAKTLTISAHYLFTRDAHNPSSLISPEAIRCRVSAYN